MDPQASHPGHGEPSLSLVWAAAAAATVSLGACPWPAAVALKVFCSLSDN